MKDYKEVKMEVSDIPTWFDILEPGWNKGSLFLGETVKNENGEYYRFIAFQGDLGEFHRLKN